MPTFKEECARIESTRYAKYSPNNSLESFIEFWDERAREIGMEAAQNEYSQLNHPYKNYLQQWKELQSCLK